MKTMQTVLWIGLVCSAAVVAGCGEKKVTLTFTNHTNNDVDVYLVEHRVSDPGLAVSANGGRARKKLSIDKDYLPISYKVRAGSLRKSFTIDKKTEDKLWFHILGTEIVGPLGEHDKADLKWERKRDRRDRHIVVE